LWPFACAVEVGVDTLEMNTVSTQDGVPVIWHDHYIDVTKCSGDYVGDFTANLTLAQVKTFDHSKQLIDHPQTELHHGTRIAALEEVLQLVNYYGDSGVTVNLETKLDSLKPNETLSVETYITDLVPELREYGFGSRTTFQTFKWRTLIDIKERYHEVVTVALWMTRR
jgi:glycerophosphoryl diester phosphodiesterase